ncbi:MAG: nucleoside-binding protein [Colwellia sp.]|nr:nucleoside-binding protein [Colwellia sp.]
MKKLATALLLTLAASTTQAKTFWSDFSVTYLNGSNYEVGDSSRQVLTFEHATGTSWGGSFLFFDRLESDNGDLETYGEWSPRIKITEFEKDSFVKSISASGTIEMGTNFGAATFSGFGFTNYLLGIGTDLNVPGFSYFKADVYARSNDLGDNNAQLTVVWGIPIGPLYYDGFMDYATSTDTSEASMNLTSQLKYDMASHLGLDSKLFVGIEYVLWLNKFGIDGVDENNLNLLVKYHF